MIDGRRSSQDLVAPLAFAPHEIGNGRRHRRNRQHFRLVSGTDDNPLDAVFGQQYLLLLLIVVGALPPALVLYRRNREG